jgi:SAM-dependent methyltransferase
VDGALGDPGHVERLDLDEVRAPSLIASEHLHRYELAASLCGGLRVADVCCGVGYGTRILREGGAASVVGVDADASAIEAARREAAGLDEVELEVADAIAFLERDELASRIEAVVMFEGLEHLADPEAALAALRRLAEAGVRLVVSIPNSRLLGEEDNPYHHTDFDHESAAAALRGLADDVTILLQFAAEGSLIRGEREGDAELDGRSVLDSRGRPELASHYIGLVGFGADAERAGARMLLEAAPVHRRYMRELEAANARLWDRLEELEARLARIESSLPYRASAPLRALLRSRGR